MTVIDALDGLMALAKKDEALRERLLATETMDNAVDAFCQEATAQGFDLDPVALVFAGEDAYATMRRATNGGGENSPLLEGQDDFYELFLLELKCLR